MNKRDFLCDVRSEGDKKKKRSWVSHPLESTSKYCNTIYWWNPFWIINTCLKITSYVDASYSRKYSIDTRVDKLNLGDADRAFLSEFCPDIFDWVTFNDPHGNQYMAVPM